MGILFSRSFNPATDIPSLSGKVVIVTGANTGLGYQTALQLALHGAKVYVGARSEVKARKAIAKMVREGAPRERLVWLPMELGIVRKAREAADWFVERERRLDILINNAGVGPGKFHLNEDGFSDSIGTNHLGHFEFTTALLPIMNVTASLEGSDVRVVNISSSGYTAAPAEVTFAGVEDFMKPWAEPNALDSFGARIARYGLSKLANILFTKELQARWDAEGVPALSLCLNPGPVATDGAIRTFNNFGPLGLLARPFLKTPLKGATTSLFAAASPDVKAHPNKYKAQYLVPYGKIGTLNQKASDPRLATQLWKTSERAIADALSANLGLPIYG